ncbi:MAG: hypothetical protein AB1589_10515 [Cyanobacteriota bacterium]
MEVYMGVYHLMGLGLSPGAVTGPISYLADKYNNWEDEGQYFFSRSGEEEQRKKGEKVGDIQAIVLFATKEVIDGTDKKFYADKYIKNRLGHIDAKEEKSEPIKKVLEPLLKEEWSKICGGRTTGCIFWCEVERRGSEEILKEQTFKRVAQVVSSLAKGTGAQGKEIWMNLTGGNNVINFALQLTASLSGGEVGRLYYVQAANENAEKCVRYTNKESYWVELPVMPLGMSDLNHAILEFLTEKEAVQDKELYSRLRSQYPHLCQIFNSPQEFKDKCLRSMQKIGFISVEKDTGICRVGSQWKLIQQYEQIMKEALDKANRERLTIEELVKQEDWITTQDISLK